MKFPGDEWWHERIVLHPVDEKGNAVILTPDGDRYIEDAAAQWEFFHPITAAGYHVSVRGNVVQFSEGIEVDDLSRLVTEARADARQYCKEQGIAAPPVWKFFFDQDGGRHAFPRDSFLDGVRRRYRGKQPAVRKRGGGLPHRPAAHPAIDLNAGDGFCWVICEGTSSVPTGSEVVLGAGSVRAGDMAIFVGAEGSQFFCRRIAVDEVVGYPEARRRALLSLARSMPSGGGDTPRYHSSEVDPEDLRQRLDLGGRRMPEDERPGGPAGGGDKETAKESCDPPGQEAGESGDLRTMWIDIDCHGRRHKPWRDVLAESSHVPFGVDEYTGPPVAMDCIRFMHQCCGDPRLWYREWKTDVELRGGDRTCHEMDCLVDAVYYGGMVDQLNLGALLGYEVIFRRLLTITDAYSGGAAKPRWTTARFMRGTGSIRDAVPQAMRSHVARRVREENEFNVASTRAAGLAVQPGGGAGGGAGGAAGEDGDDGAGAAAVAAPKRIARGRANRQRGLGGPAK